VFNVVFGIVGLQHE